MEQELRVQCIKERNSYRLGEGHFINKVELKAAYREAVDSLYLDLVAETHNEGKVLAPLIQNLFTINALTQDDKSMNEVMAEISAIDPSIKHDLEKYFLKADAAAKTLDEIGSIPKYRDLGHFIDVMDKRYQESGMLE